MEVVLKHFVRFVFNRDYFDDERDSEFCGYLPDGSVDDFESSFEEIEISNRDLANLEVPEGSCRFWFYDRMVAFAEFDGKPIELRSGELNVSISYCYLKYGRVFTRQTPKEEFDPHTVLYENIQSGAVQPFFDEGGDGCYLFKPEDVFVEAGKLKEVELKWQYLR